MKTFLIAALVTLTVSCSSTISKVNQASSEVSNGASALENVSNTVDRAIATEKRIEEKWGARK